MYEGGGKRREEEKRGEEEEEGESGSDYPHWQYFGSNAKEREREPMFG